MIRRARHALVTGAAGAIGRAIASEIAALDKDTLLSLVDIDASGASRVAEELGGRAAAFRWDLSRPDDVAHELDAVRDARGEVDLLVNCAGLMHVGSFAATSWDLASRMLAIDLLSPLRLMSLVVPRMVRERCGAVVNVTSMAGVTPLRGCAFYGAAKAGLAMASEIAHLELAPSGVHVVTVYPGPVRSELERRARAQYQASFFARFAPTGDPEELGRRIVLALERRLPRIVYPALYDVASRFPGIAIRFTRAFSPSALD